jgi:hypothetical protein
MDGGIRITDVEDVVRQGRLRKFGRPNRSREGDWVSECKNELGKLGKLESNKI